MNIDLFLLGIEIAHEDLVREAVLAFNSVQIEYRIQIRQHSSPDDVPNEINWESFRKEHGGLRGESRRIFLTDRRLSDNWFSHSDGALAVISTHQWFQLYAPPSLQSFLLLEFGLTVACFTCALDESHLQPHYRSVGCVGDMCGFKPDVLLKLRAGYICSDHLSLFRQYGANDRQAASVIRVVELARAYALARDDEKRRLGAIRSRKVFVVHGRDGTARKQLVAALKALQLVPVVIIDKVTRGRTIIEQIEEHSDVGFAFVLFTPDDKGSLAESTDLKPRPRQNVVFEYGLFVGLLTRSRVCCVARSSPLELPSDLAGVLQLRYDTSVSELKAQIKSELTAAGYTFDGRPASKKRMRVSNKMKRNHTKSRSIR